MQTLAIIPARGGSKGVPGKNLQPLAGKPLIAYTIEQAKQATTVDRVVVSTDDPQIAAVAQRWGAEVVTRPEAISGDSATSESALLHAIEHLRQGQGYEPDLLVFLQCTSPLTLAQDIDGTVRALLDQEADTALAAVDFHYFLWRADPDQGAVGINHDRSTRQLRQQRDPQYLEAGAVYAMRTAGFIQNKHRFFGKTVLYPMPAERRLEIDTPADFVVAEAVLASQRSGGALDLLPAQVDALVLDFDGVMTDNRVTVGVDGSELVTCSRGDGKGISLLKGAGVPVLVISSEENRTVQARCKKLNIPCKGHILEKLPVLKEWLSEAGLSMANTVYVGNDVNDLTCLNAVGCPVVVADAHPQTKRAAKIVLQAAGGYGAVREICDLIIQARKK